MGAISYFSLWPWWRGHTPPSGFDFPPSSYLSGLPPRCFPTTPIFPGATREGSWPPIFVRTPRSRKLVHFRFCRNVFLDTRRDYFPPSFFSAPSFPKGSPQSFLFLLFFFVQEATPMDSLKVPEVFSFFLDA